MKEMVLTGVFLVKVRSQDVLKQLEQKKCNCSFILKGQNLANDSRWVLKVMCAVHNHLEGHSYAGRLIEKEDNLLIDM